MLRPRFLSAATGVEQLPKPVAELDGDDGREGV